MAARLSTRARAPSVGVVGLLLATCLLLAAATVASAGRPLKVSSSSSEGDGAQQHTAAVESPPVVAGYIQTVVAGTAEQDVRAAAAAGHRLMKNLSVDMLAGIKNSGPSPGDGH